MVITKTQKRISFYQIKETSPPTRPVVIKIQEPPPVVLSNIKGHSVINQMLQTKKLNFKANLMNNNQLKINVGTEPEYR